MNIERVVRIFGPARKFIILRARRTKCLVQDCIPKAWGRKASNRKTYQSRETQTSLIIEDEDDSKSGNSSITNTPHHDFHQLGTDGSFGSEICIDVPGVADKTFTDRSSSSNLKIGSCPCIQHLVGIDGGGSLNSSQSHSVFEKLDELQQQVHLIHNTLCSLQPSGISSDGFPSIVPPPPPMPPTIPYILHPVPQASMAPLRRQESSVVVSNGLFSQDDGKPLITLEEIQKVKLRKTSSFAKKGLSSNISAHYEFEDCTCESSVIGQQP